jgi:two-component system, sensor histidine kinase and response regulator
MSKATYPPSSAVQKGGVNSSPSTPILQRKSGKEHSAASLRAPPLVLVVDDQARNLQTVKKLLTSDGYQVLTAESGEEALRSLSSHWPDLILLDVVMPEMDGFEVCEKIKDNPATQNIPIIFLSGDTGHQSVMTGFAKGGIDYISKPFNKSELLARVRTHVELHRNQVRNVMQVQERQRTLDLIVHEWHKPLQRISLFLRTIYRDMEEAERPGSMLALSKEAMRETEHMLTSVEGFLHQQSSVADAFSEGEIKTGLTTDDIKSMAGKWYVTAKRKLVELILSAPEAPIPVPGLAFAINQIVDAVLSNAVNFTPKSGRIEVRISEENDRLVLRVKDDGPGFSEEYLRRQFQPYMHQKDGHKQSTLGVGLASAKRIADRIQATLTISNRIGGSGGYVKVIFPLRPTKELLAPEIKETNNND